MMRQGGSKQLDVVDGQQQTADDSIHSGRYHCCHPLSSIVDNAFDGGSTLSLSDCGHRHHNLVISLPPLSGRRRRRRRRRVGLG
jgi:hypothetical protein